MWQCNDFCYGKWLAVIKFYWVYGFVTYSRIFVGVYYKCNIPKNGGSFAMIWHMELMTGSKTAHYLRNSGQCAYMNIHSIQTRDWDQRPSWIPTEVSTTLVYWCFFVSMQCHVLDSQVITCFAAHLPWVLFYCERRCTQNEWSKKTSDMRLKGLDKTKLTFFLQTYEPTKQPHENKPLSCNCT